MIRVNSGFTGADPVPDRADHGRRPYDDDPTYRTIVAHDAAIDHRSGNTPASRRPAQCLASSGYCERTVGSHSMALPASIIDTSRLRRANATELSARAVHAARTGLPPPGLPPIPTGLVNPSNDSGLVRV